MVSRDYGQSLEVVGWGKRGKESARDQETRGGIDKIKTISERISLESRAVKGDVKSSLLVAL